MSDVRCNAMPIATLRQTTAARIIVWLDILVRDLSGVYHSTVNVLPRISDRKASIKGLGEIIGF